MKRMIWIFLALLNGCGMSDTNRIVSGKTMTFTGHVHQGWEWSYFEADGEPEKFALLGSPELNAKMEELYPPQTTPAYVDKHAVGTFRGIISETKGRGPWGNYRYKFNVNEVLEIRIPDQASGQVKNQ